MGQPGNFDFEDEKGFLTSRAFALGLIGIASLYVLVMICQAYSQNMSRVHHNGFTDRFIAPSSDYYEYETESYDFRPYQSIGTDGERSIQRGFHYNESIKGSSSYNDN
mmetsp:Transcript_14394/g.24530  ORF Transcript_14394/g.24530 Transcript_14394/m.24530 type:complete len:108 (+) Transcript_14394:242-565(+)